MPHRKADVNLSVADRERGRGLRRHLQPPCGACGSTCQLHAPSPALLTLARTGSWVSVPAAHGSLGPMGDELYVPSALHIRILIEHVATSLPRFAEKGSRDRIADLDDIHPGCVYICLYIYIYIYILLDDLPNHVLDPADHHSKNSCLDIQRMWPVSFIPGRPPGTVRCPATSRSLSEFVHL